MEIVCTGCLLDFAGKALAYTKIKVQVLQVKAPPSLSPGLPPGEANQQSRSADTQK